MRMSDITHSYIWQWIIRLCDMTHSCVWHDSFVTVKGHVSLKRDLYYSKTSPKRDLYHSKETHITQMTSISLKGNQYQSKETHKVMHIIPSLFLLYDSRRALLFECDSWICMTQLIHIFDTHIFVYTFVRVPWLIHKCDMAHSYLLRHSWRALLSLRVWLMHMTHSYTHVYVWHDSFIHVTWLLHMTHSYTHSYAWQWLIDISFISVTWLIHTCCVTLTVQRTLLECGSFESHWLMKYSFTRIQETHWLIDTLEYIRIDS